MLKYKMIGTILGAAKMGIFIYALYTILPILAYLYGFLAFLEVWNSLAEGAHIMGMLKQHQTKATTSQQDKVRALRPVRPGDKE